MDDGVKVVQRDSDRERFLESYDVGLEIKCASNVPAVITDVSNRAEYMQ